MADGQVTVQQVWHDYIVPIGLDHRCVHCILQWSGARPPPKHRGINLKNWAPKVDEHGTASSFCNCLTEQLTRIQEVSCQSLEKCLEKCRPFIASNYGPSDVSSNIGI